MSRTILALCLFTVVVRSAGLAVFDHWGQGPTGDGFSYDTIAVHLMEEGEYRNPLNNFRARRAPGYTYFLATVYTVFGHSFDAVRIVQILLSAAVVALVFVMTARHVSRTAGLAAATLVICSPTLALSDGVLFTECLFTFWGVVALFCFLRMRDADTRPWLFAVLGGVALGCAALTRPVGLLYATALGIVLLPAVIHAPRVQAPRAVAWGVCLLLTLAPWTIRNYTVFGELVPITTMGGFVFFEANNPWVVDNPRMIGGQMRGERLPPGRTTARMPERERDTYLFAWSLHYLADTPEHIPVLLAAKARRFWSLWPDLRGFSFPVRIGYAAYYLVLFGGAAVGLVAGRSHYRAVFLPAVAVIAAAFTGALLYWAGGRIRAPVEPALAILAGTGWTYIVERYRPGVHSRLAGTAPDQ